MQTAPIKDYVELDSQAAAQAVKTKKRRRLPKLSLDFRELWVKRDIQRVGDTDFGRFDDEDDYENRRLNLELDQPLFDGTIKPEVAAAEARRRQMDSRSSLLMENRTREVIEQFINAVRFRNLIDSTNSVISQVESELNTVSRQKDANVATVSDVQNVRLALVSLKRDRSKFRILLSEALSILGASANHLDAVNLGWSQNNHTAAWLSKIEVGENSPEIAMLRAEAEDIANRARATRRRWWPVLSLYSRYGSDYGGSPEYSAFRYDRRDLNYFEAGVVVKWNIFDRGMNSSEAKELELRSRAKEKELEERARDRERSADLDQQLLHHAVTSLEDLTELRREYRILEEAAERAYRAGQGSYINFISAFLAREAAQRDWIHARHDLLSRRITLHANSSSWNDDLVAKVDRIFTAAR